MRTPTIDATASSPHTTPFAGTGITTSTPGGSLAWQVSLSNQGWARPLNARNLALTLVSATNEATVLPLAGTDLRQASPGEPLQWAGEVTLPATLAPGSYRVPPPQVESMYRPSWQALGSAPSSLVVRGR